MSTTTNRAAEDSMTSFAGIALEGGDEILEALDSIAGQRVALVGDATEVARLTARLAERVSSLTVFQTEGAWVLPFAGGVMPALGSLGRLLSPETRRRLSVAAAEHHRRRGVRDAWTRRQLTPRESPRRQHIVYSDRYHRALRQRHVRLVTWPIAGYVADGLRTADGLEHHVDVIARV